MDNMDGAAGTVGAVCAGGIACFSLGRGNNVLAAFALAIAGACLAFLRYNLRRGDRARIFLGDGGSMPLGFLLAAATTQIPVSDELGWPGMLVGALMLGILVLDTLLVVVSRTRRRIPLTTGGRDHLTHRLHARLGSPAAVAVALAATQATLTVVAVAAFYAGSGAIVATAAVCFALGLAIVLVLEGPAWMPALDEPAA
jgi:UDP-GlcNAc:undecaprenyl-phosphate GlcNAc-1-phosphate transferase